MTAPSTARARARTEITREILSAGREHLARDGAAGLSLRAVARDLGMASSAVYRYVPNRDALLTMLIIEAYDSLGEAVERAEAAVPRAHHRDRFLTVCHAVRTWALAHPHEYALIYGSPVPGYAAPTDTITPASRVPNVLMTIIVDLQQSPHPAAPREISDAVAATVRPVQQVLGGLVSDDLMLRGLAAWSAMFGAVSFELYGHLHNVVAEGARARRTYFDHQMGQIADGLGLA